MSQWLSLETPTGRIDAWRADPPASAKQAPAKGAPVKGALVVVQEIFGVNSHIRAVCERFAAHGFIALAPALFDHFEHRVELDYTPEGIEHGRGLVARLGFDCAVEDVNTAATLLDAEAGVGVVGYCWGGTVALLANTRLGRPAVSYYGGRSVPFLHEQLDAPMLFHFGERDPIIPPEDVALHRRAYPDAEFFVYPAGHGFNCDQRGDFDGPSSDLALERTLAFFERTLHRPPDTV